MLNRVVGFDPSHPPEVEHLDVDGVEVSSVGGPTRRVTVHLREWENEGTLAAARAVELVSAASLAVLHGGPATLVDVHPAGR
ncbi:hypothetical protein [Mycolicibacterium sp. YH-1]|uniref:hypothetical protein n=1 Tax=Mycolicibacterium sp. YH-1 TaxID=2908837 RepID=UPI001F4C4194|nr:hypothetical protein [Mycolicibacterium sp. YH-1]UNB50132.1 hypothetical protein L0M16_19280 [Mycolicibacterium sp. YH-1]